MLHYFSYIIILNLIIDWERLGSTGGPLRSGPRGGTGPWGQYKTPGMLGFIPAQRGRARSALFSQVTFYFLIFVTKSSIVFGLQE